MGVFGSLDLLVFSPLGLWPFESLDIKVFGSFVSLGSLAFWYSDKDQSSKYPKGPESPKGLKTKGLKDPKSPKALKDPKGSKDQKT